MYATPHAAKRLIERGITPPELSRALYEPHVIRPGVDGTEVRRHGNIQVVVYAWRILTVARRAA